MSEAAAFHTPVILTLLCAMAGAAVWLAAVSWLWGMYSGKAAEAGRLRGAVWRWLARVIVLVAFISLGVNLAEGRGFGYVWPEMAVIILVFAIYARSAGAQNFPREVGRTFACAAAIAALWAVSIALGWGMQIIVPVPGFAVFTVGLLWLAASVLLYLQVRKKALAGTINLPERFSFSAVMWALLLACAILILPLLIEHIGNAPKLREALEAGPPLRRV